MRPWLRAFACLVLVAGLTGAGVTPASASPDPPATGTDFHPMTPTRVLDTRNGTGVASAGPVGAGAVAEINLSSLIPDTSDPATSVVLNVTVTDVTASTFVTALPHFTGTAPGTSTLNLSAGQTRANLVTVGTNNGKIDFFNHSGSVDIIADVEGFNSNVTGDTEYTPITPTRALDTRNTGGPLGSKVTRSLDLSSIVPTSAVAVTLNVTALDATANTFVTAWGAGPQPNASNINVGPGAITPNQVIVDFEAGFDVNLFNNAGNTDLVVDVAGYYSVTSDITSQTSFSGDVTGRVLDTRNGTGTGKAAPVGKGGVVTLDLSGTLPPQTTAVELNLTGTDVTANTFITAWQDGVTRPLASDLNLVPGQTAANLVTVPVSSSGKIDLFNNVGTVDLVADVEGYFAPPETNCTTGCAFGFGNDFGGALGDRRGGTVQTSPAALYGLTNVVSIAETDQGNADYALRSDGTVWKWGGSISNVPTLLAGLTGVTALSTSQNGGFALKSDGTVWSFGDDSLITGQTTTTPTQIAGLSGVTAISSGQSDLEALESNGTVTMLGENTVGQIGNGTTCSCDMGPTQVSGLTGVTAISGGFLENYALRSDGTVWSWGFAGGALHTGTGIVESGNGGSSTPLQVNGLTNITQITSDSAFFSNGPNVTGEDENGYALRSDGTVWAWGGDQHGELGNGTTAGAGLFSVVPNQVSGLTNVVSISSGTVNGYAIESDGSAWGWGLDAADSLDDGNTSGEADTPKMFPILATPTTIFAGLGATWLFFSSVSQPEQTPAKRTG